MQSKNKLEIWGKAQSEAARHCKSDWGSLGPRLLICQDIYYKCGQMALPPKPLNESH